MRSGAITPPSAMERSVAIARAAWWSTASGIELYPRVGFLVPHPSRSSERMAFYNGRH
jgi:hypothetical protein